jgi:hypothetical protein
MALIGKHHINLRIPKDSKLSEINFDQELEFDELEYSLEKKFGTDTWVLNVGKVLFETIKLTNQARHSTSKVQITNLTVTRFKKGIMQWSTHEVRIGFDFDVIKEGQSLKNGHIEGAGTGNGNEFGVLTFIPILGNINFDKGIELALSRSLESGLNKLQKGLKT